MGHRSSHINTQYPSNIALTSYVEAERGWGYARDLSNIGNKDNAAAFIVERNSNCRGCICVAGFKGYWAPYPFWRTVK